MLLHIKLGLADERHSGDHDHMLSEHKHKMDEYLLSTEMER